LGQINAPRFIAAAACKFPLKFILPSAYLSSDQTGPNIPLPSQYSVHISLPSILATCPAQHALTCYYPENTQ